jgi:hypothetical protein
MSGHRLHKSKEYRERAHRSREVAHWMSDRATRQHLLKTAQHFETLAESEEQEVRESILSREIDPSAGRLIRSRF